MKQANVHFPNIRTKLQHGNLKLTLKILTTSKRKRNAKIVFLDDVTKRTIMKFSLFYTKCIEDRRCELNWSYFLHTIKHRVAEI